MKDDSTRPTPAAVLVVAPIMALCLVCSAMACTSEVWLARLDQPSSFAIPVCIWARHGRVGLWWNANVAPASAFAHAHRYNALCAATLWSPMLPTRGRPSVDVTP